MTHVQLSWTADNMMNDGNDTGATASLSVHHDKEGVYVYDCVQSRLSSDEPMSNGNVDSIHVLVRVVDIDVFRFIGRSVDSLIETEDASEGVACAEVCSNVPRNTSYYIIEES